MPIEGVTPENALGTFRTHVNDLLNGTITRDQLTHVVQGRTMQIAFRDNTSGDVRQTKLQSDFGDLGWYFGHVCDAQEIVRNRYRLRSISYAYRLYAWGSNEPFVRWEYERFPKPPTATYARHHLQGPMMLQIGTRSVLLNDLHLPTGWITIEDVIRFLINDLGVRPRQASWAAHLDESYRTFRTEFVGPQD